MLTIAENSPHEAYEILDAAGPVKTPSATSHALGITGAPGVGKSSLVGALVREFRRAGQTAAVLAVDPSSPFRGGALLGDRIRMNEHAGDPGVYIRSMATRGILGGLTRPAWLCVRVMEAWGFDWVLVETAGVGQNETDVASLADTTLLVLSPGMGDDVQVMKAGILEVADLYVINKSDLEGADRLRSALASVLPGGRPVYETVANRSAELNGVPELAAGLAERALRFAESDTGLAYAQARFREEVRRAVLDLMAEQVDRELDREVSGTASPGSSRTQTDPLAVAGRIVARLGKHDPSRRQGGNGLEIPGLESIDHLGIAVEDLAAGIAAWESLGLTIEGTEVVAEQKVRVAMFPCGESRIELLESTDPNGPVGKFITKRGPGIHHVAFAVQDIDRVLGELRTRGVRLIDETPRIGAGGARIAFIHPSATGVLVELCEHPGSTGQETAEGAG
jgi:LAO/AO transport system kinase